MNYIKSIIVAGCPIKKVIFYLFKNLSLMGQQKRFLLQTKQVRKTYYFRDWFMPVNYVF